MQVAIAVTPKKVSFAPLMFTGRMEYGIRRAAELGCDAVEIHIANPSQIDVEATARLIDSLGLKVSGIGTGLACYEDKLTFTTTDEAMHTAAISRLKSHIEFAQRLGGAIVIIGGMRGKLEGDPGSSLRNELRQASIEAHRAVGRYGAQHGVPVVMEPINRYETNFINTVAQGLEYLGEIANDNVSMLVDTFHMNIEEVSIAESIRAAGDSLSYVHLADSNRWAAGFGHTDFVSVFNALHDIGYEGPISGEVLPLPDDESAARQEVDFIRGHW